MLEDELTADILRNWVYCFCFVLIIDVVMYKIDSGLTEGGEEDGRGRKGGKKGFTDKPNHPILLLKGGEVWMEIKEWTETGWRERAGRKQGIKEEKVKRFFSLSLSRFNDKKALAWKSEGLKSQGLNGRSGNAGWCLQVVLITSIYSALFTLYEVLCSEKPIKIMLHVIITIIVIITVLRSENPKIPNIL